MNKEDKELLLKDLSARLPFGVICYNSNTESNFILEDVADISSGYPIFDYGYGSLETIKPYLRPLSSMTEGERVEFKWLNDKCEELPTFEYVPVEHYKIFDWLNRHHFDYHNLIERGLAIDCTNLNVY